jgi:hypothetical protein
MAWGTFDVMTINPIPEIRDELLIDDLATLRQLASPFRLRLLHAFRSPQSVADVASSMAVPVTRLYYHVNILEDVGAIIVTGTRKKGPQLEKVYRIAAHGIRPSPSILSDGGDPVEFAEVAASLVLDSARAELVEALTRHAASGFDPASVTGSLGRTLTRLPHARALEIIDELQALTVAMKDEDSADATLYGFTYLFFPLEPQPTDTTSGAKENSP